MFLVAITCFHGNRATRAGWWTWIGVTVIILVEHSRAHTFIKVLHLCMDIMPRLVRLIKYTVLDSCSILELRDTILKTLVKCHIAISLVRPLPLSLYNKISLQWIQTRICSIQLDNFDYHHHWFISFFCYITWFSGTGAFTVLMQRTLMHDDDDKCNA